MGTVVARLECRHCGKICKLADLRENHGPGKPRCVGHRWSTWAQAGNYVSAGSYTALLTAAGVVKRVPLYVHWRVPADKKGNYLTSWHDKRYDHSVLIEMVDYHALVPSWAYELASKISRDKTLARKLGFVQTKELVTQWERRERPTGIRGKGTVHEMVAIKKEWQSCDKDKQLPMHLRVKIMQVAARNDLARELIFDDPECAGRIIRDVH